MAEDELWACFLQQRGHILDKKWTDSEKAGADIGIERALRNWLQKHYTLLVADLCRAFEIAPLSFKFRPCVPD
jgi:hypothetical protein